MTTTYLPITFHLSRRHLRYIVATFGALLCVLLGVAIAPTVSSALAHVRVSLTDMTEAPSQPAELPREWRWERTPITLDHMYRSAAHQAGDDALRLRVASRAQSPIQARTARFAKRRGANAGGP